MHCKISIVIIIGTFVLVNCLVTLWYVTESIQKVWVALHLRHPSRPVHRDHLGSSLARVGSAEKPWDNCRHPVPLRSQRARSKPCDKAQNPLLVCYTIVEKQDINKSMLRRSAQALLPRLLQGQGSQGLGCLSSFNALPIWNDDKDSIVAKNGYNWPVGTRGKRFVCLMVSPPFVFFFID